MSMAEALGRMQGIQSMIAELTRPAQTAQSTAAAQKASAVSTLASGTGTANSAAFTDALTAALGGTGGTTQTDLSSLTGAAPGLGLGALTGLALPTTPAATPVAAGSATGTDVVAMAKKYSACRTSGAGPTRPRAWTAPASPSGSSRTWASTFPASSATR